MRKLKFTVRSLAGLVAVPAAVAAAVLPGTVASAAAAAPSAAAFTAPAGAGISTEIVLDQGNYKQCLNDRGQNHAAGAPVTIYACGTDQVANYWLTYPDNTIRPQGAPTMAVTVGSTDKLVLEPVAASGPTDVQVWYFRADGGIESGASTAGLTSFLANSPQQSTANNTQQIVFDQSAVTANAHWYVTKARYGTTATLSDRPDSGGNGNWANDRITRRSMLVYLGDATTGVHSYQGSVADSGTFHALAGAYTPNQGGADAGAKLGDSLGGSISGLTGYQFTSTAFVSASPAAAYSGSQPSTSSYYQLFFAPGTTFGGAGIDSTGPVQWAWTYTSNKDNCGNVETWTDASYNSGGQVYDAGNITAPAAGSCTS